MTEMAIERGFSACGMRPFDRKRILQLVEENTGAPTEKGIGKRVKNAVSAVIGERKEAVLDREKKIEKGAAVVKKNVPYGPEEISELN